MEAARSLGMTYTQAMRFVILPQAVRRMLPPLANEFITLLKTARCSRPSPWPSWPMCSAHSGRYTVYEEPLYAIALIYLAMTLLPELAVFLAGKTVQPATAPLIVKCCFDADRGRLKAQLRRSQNPVCGFQTACAFFIMAAVFAKESA